VAILEQVEENVGNFEAVVITATETTERGKVLRLMLCKDCLTWDWAVVRTS
jgi:hypothetical protein